VGQISADYRAVAFTLAVTTFTAIVLALFAAFRTATLVTRESTNVRTTSTSGRGRYSADLLLVGQITLAVTLLACAGLLIRSFESLTRVNLGFARDGVVTMRTTLSGERYDSADRIRVFTTDLLTRAASIRGVQSVGSANYRPLTNVGEGFTFEIEGRT